MRVRIWNEHRSTALASQAVIAESFWTRFLGLMGRATLAPGDGMVFPDTNAIHMFFMRIPLAVMYLDGTGRVLVAIDHLAPWRLGPIVWRAKTVVELPAGTVSRTGTAVGDQIRLESMEVAHG